MVVEVEEKKVELETMDLVAPALLQNVYTSIVQEVQTVIVWDVEEIINTQEDLDVVDLQ
jgi:hypothetical protein